MKRQKYLIFGGRVTLAMLVITSVPLLYMSMFNVPSKVRNKPRT